MKRIEVVRGESVVPVTEQQPSITSSQAPLRGFVMEEHHLPNQEFRGAFTGHLITVNLGEAYWKEWRTEGKSGRLLIPPGGSALCSGQMLWCAWDRPIRFAGLVIQMDAMERVAYEVTHRPVELRPEPGVSDDVITGFVTSILSDVRAGCPAGALLGESLATDLATYLLRQYTTHPIQRRYFKGGMPRRRIERVIEYIEASLARDLGIAELAGVACMSPYYFGRLFKQSTGFSVHQYVMKRRIQRAIGLLGNAELEIREIGAAIGIPDQSQFTRFFHQHAGTTPRRYRQLR